MKGTKIGATTYNLQKVLFLFLQLIKYKHKINEMTQ